MTLRDRTPANGLIMSSRGNTVFCHLKGSIVPQSIHHSSPTRRPEWGELLRGIGAIVSMIVRARAWWLQGPRAHDKQEADVINEPRQSSCAPRKE